MKHLSHRRRSRSAAFTLIEALVSIAIAAMMILMLATIFRQIGSLQRRTGSRADASRVARQVFSLIARDLTGLSRKGFLMIRTQKINYSMADANSRAVLCFDGNGDGRFMENARADMLVMLTSGYHVSATNSDRSSCFARVIWSHTERINGIDTDSDRGGSTTADTLKLNPKFWGANQVLSRHQTLCIPDRYSATERWSDYKIHYTASGDRNRGPDYYNMGLGDILRWFDDAMVGVSSEGRLISMPTNSTSPPVNLDSPHHHLLFGGRGYGGHLNECQPYRYTSGVFRFGRDGSDEAGSIGDGVAGQAREGGGDLATSQIYVTVPSGVADGTEAGRQAAFLRQKDSTGGPRLADDPRDGPEHQCMRGYERPRIFGPKDYHRIAAFGVAGFQVEWSDGRIRPAAVGDDNEKSLRFYSNSAGGVESNINFPGLSNDGTHGDYTYVGGPGEAYAYAWNPYSPGTVRESLVLKGGLSVKTYGSYEVPTEYVRLALNQYGCEGLDSRYLQGAWPWPKALRIRITLVKIENDQPVAFTFERVFHLLSQ